MDKLKLSTANIVILVAGVVMLIASFLAFNKISIPSFSSGGVKFGGGSKSYSAWSTGHFLIATIPALIGVVMAAHVAIVEFASGVKLPEKVLGLSWNQVHLVLGFQATIMMLAFLIQSTPGLDKGIGLFLMLIAAIALLVGAVLRMQEKTNPAI
jgi:hypothetical protein